MTEISTTQLIETFKNSAGEDLGQRELDFYDTTSAQALLNQKVITITKVPSQSLVGQQIEIKHTTNLAQYDILTVSQISTTTITVTANLTYTYPSGSRIFIVARERDIFDATVSSRTESKANVAFIEVEFRAVD